MALNSMLGFVHGKVCKFIDLLNTYVVSCCLLVNWKGAHFPNNCYKIISV